MCPAGSQSIVTDLATVTPTVLANCKSGRFLSNLSGSTCLVCLVTQGEKNKNQTWQENIGKWQSAESYLKCCDNCPQWYGEHPTSIHNNVSPVNTPNEMQKCVLGYGYAVQITRYRESVTKGVSQIIWQLRTAILFCQRLLNRSEEGGRRQVVTVGRVVERGNTMTCSAHPSRCQTVDLSCAGRQHVKTLFALKDGDNFLKTNASLVFRSLHLHLHMGKNSVSNGRVCTTFSSMQPKL